MIVYPDEILEEVADYLEIDQFILHGVFDIDGWLEYLLNLISVYEQE